MTVSTGDVSVWTLILDVPWEMVGLGVAVIIGGGWLLHEATHYLVAWVIGANPSVHIDSRMKTTYERQWDIWDELFGRRTSGYWLEMAVQLAPSVVGIITGVAYLTLWGWPPFTFAGYTLSVAWFFYTYSPDDWRLATRSIRVDPLTKHATLALLAFFAGYAVQYTAHSGTWGLFADYIFIACLISAGAMLGLGLYDDADLNIDTANRQGNFKFQ